MTLRRSISPALTLSLALLGGGLVAAAPSDAQAADSCTTVANVSSKIWKKTPAVVKTAIAKSGPFGATAMEALKMIDEGIKLWNKFADDGPAKVGARRIDFEAWNKGTLWGPTERMFISGIPAVNPVVVDFHKLDHAGKVKVVDSFPDIRVKVVRSFPDIKVKKVRSFADDCGECSGDPGLLGP